MAKCCDLKSRLLSLPNNIIPTCTYSYHQYSNRCDLPQGVLIQKNQLIKSTEKLQNLLLPLIYFSKRIMKVDLKELF